MSKHEEALERAKKEYQNADGISREILERIFPELSESEDEKIRKAIVRTVESFGPKSANPKMFNDMLAWLEKQKPVEWDNKKMDWICSCLKDYPRLAKFKDESFKEFSEYADWLKSFKPRPHWKPSEEQLLSLKFIIKNYPDYVYNADLESLYEDLKKL